jgi:hypothetical protein
LTTFLAYDPLIFTIKVTMYISIQVSLHDG